MIYDRKWLETIKDGRKLIEDMPAVLQQVPNIVDRFILVKQFRVLERFFKNEVDGGFDPERPYLELLSLFKLASDLIGE